jgi:hypothetical protein
MLYRGRHNSKISPASLDILLVLIMNLLVDGNIYGNCIAFPNGDYNCDTNSGELNLHGYRKFRCLTKFTADDLNNSV